jgi:predicted ATPase
LRLPDLDRLPVLSELAGTEAVALFVARAKATDPAFALSEANALTVAAICARLDGLPLALELAAARVPTLPLPVLLARLEHALPLLTGGARDAPDRQRTMRDAIAWSYDLLGAADQALLRRLAVFVGGFTLGAAEDLSREAGAESGRSELPPPASVLDGIEALVTASLLRATSDPLAEEPRFRMLETVREFGLEQLTKSGEEAVTRAAHAEYFATLAERAAEAFYGPAEDAWFARLEADHANFLSALAWCVDRQDHDRLGRLVSALWWFWATGGHMAEGRTWLGQAVAATTDAPPPLRAQVVCAAGYCAANESVVASATPLLDECLAMAEATGDREAAARAVALLAIATPGSDLDRAEAFAAEAAERWRALGPSVLWVECLLTQGHVAWAKGKLDLATTYIEEALALARAHGFAWGIALAFNFLGSVAFKRGGHCEAAVQYAAALEIVWRRGDTTLVHDNLARLAIVASALGHPARAARLAGATDTLAAAHGLAMMLPTRVDYEPALAAARAALGEGVFADAVAAGRAPPLAEAIAEALSIGEPATAGSQAQQSEAP